MKKIAWKFKRTKKNFSTKSLDNRVQVRWRLRLSLKIRGKMITSSLLMKTNYYSKLMLRRKSHYQRTWVCRPQTHSQSTKKALPFKKLWPILRFLRILALHSLKMLAKLVLLFLRSWSSWELLLVYFMSTIRMPSHWSALTKRMEKTLLKMRLLRLMFIQLGQNMLW